MALIGKDNAPRGRRFVPTVPSEPSACESVATISEGDLSKLLRHDEIIQGDETVLPPISAGRRDQLYDEVKKLYEKIRPIQSVA